MKRTSVKIEGPRKVEGSTNKRSNPPNAERLEGRGGSPINRALARSSRTGYRTWRTVCRKDSLVFLAKVGGAIREKWGGVSKCKNPYRSCPYWLGKQQEPRPRRKKPHATMPVARDGETTKSGKPKKKIDGNIKRRGGGFLRGHAHKKKRPKPTKGRDCIGRGKPKRMNDEGLSGGLPPYSAGPDSRYRNFMEFFVAPEKNGVNVLGHPGGVKKN